METFDKIATVLFATLAAVTISYAILYNDWNWYVWLIAIVATVISAIFMGIVRRSKPLTTER